MASKEAPVAEEMDSQSQLAAHQVSFRRETETELQGADEEVAPDESEGGGEGDVQKQPKRQKVSQMQDVPLVVPQAVCKDKKASLLVQLKEGDLDFSGDTGAIGRITVPSKGKAGLAFDLKGQQFDGQIMRSATMLVVGVGPTEAKVEGLFSEFCDLYYKGDVFEAMGGDVLKGEMDISYKFEEENVNARGGGGIGNGTDISTRDGDGAGGGTKSGRARGPKGGVGGRKGGKGSGSSASGAKKGHRGLSAKRRRG